MKKEIFYIVNQKEETMRIWSFGKNLPYHEIGYIFSLLIQFLPEYLKLEKKDIKQYCQKFVRKYRAEYELIYIFTDLCQSEKEDKGEMLKLKSCLNYIEAVKKNSKLNSEKKFRQLWRMLNVSLDITDRDWVIYRNGLEAEEIDKLLMTYNKAEKGLGDTRSLLEFKKEIDWNIGEYATDMANLLHPVAQNDDETVYRLSNLQNLITACLLQIFAHQKAFCQCEVCGKWFVPLKRKDTKYCYFPNGKRYCCDLARLKKQREREKRLSSSRKMYKNVYAMLFARKENEEDENFLHKTAKTEHRDRFENFKKENISFRNQVANGIITEEEYIDWLKTFYIKKYKKLKNA